MFSRLKISAPPADSINPVSRAFGIDRGQPIDRYYIEAFLRKNSNYIKGTALEIGESTYSKKFGGAVERFEVLHFAPGNPEATIIGDLTQEHLLPLGIADCFICTQTFNFIYDFKSAIHGAYALLAPGGTLLATLAGISQISRYDMDRWGDYWRFTTLSAHMAFAEVFGEEQVEVESYGNCLAAKMFLNGNAAEELQCDDLDSTDPDYQMIITVRATKYDDTEKRA